MTTKTQKTVKKDKFYKTLENDYIQAKTDFAFWESSDRKQDFIVLLDDCENALKFYREKILSDPDNPELYTALAESYKSPESISLREKSYLKAVELSRIGEYVNNLLNYYIPNMMYISCEREVRRLLNLDISLDKKLQAKLQCALGICLSKREIIFYRNNIWKRDYLEYLKLATELAHDQFYYWCYTLVIFCLRTFYFRTRDFKTALKVFSETNERLVLFYSRSIYYQHQLKDYDQAGQMYEKAMTCKDINQAYYVYTYYISLLLEQEKLEKAKEIAYKGTEVFSERQEFFELCGKSFYDSKQYEIAEEFLNTAIGLEQSKNLKMHQLDYWNFMYLGYTFAAQEKYTEAIDNLFKAVVISFQSQKYGTSNYFMFPDKQEKDFIEKIFELYPSNPKCRLLFYLKNPEYSKQEIFNEYRNRFQRSNKAKEVNEMIELSNFRCKINATYPELSENAPINLTIDRIEKEYNSYYKLKRDILSSADTENRNLYLNALLTINYLTEQFVHCEDIVSILANKGHVNAYSHKIAGMIHNRRRRYQKAEMELLAALRINHHDAEIYLELIKCYTTSGQYKKAKRIFYYALKYITCNNDFYIKTSLILIENGMYPEAKKVFSRLEIETKSEILKMEKTSEATVLICFIKYLIATKNYKKAVALIYRFLVCMNIYTREYDYSVHHYFCQVDELLELIPNEFFHDTLKDKYIFETLTSGMNTHSSHILLSYYYYFSGILQEASRGLR